MVQGRGTNRHLDCPRNGVRGATAEQQFGFGELQPTRAVGRFHGEPLAQIGDRAT